MVAMFSAGVLVVLKLARSIQHATCRCRNRFVSVHVTLAMRSSPAWTLEWLTTASVCWKSERASVSTGVPV